MPLTDVEIRSKKKGANVIKLSDGGGLQLHVMPTGSRLWRLAFRLHGKQRQLALGSYPDLSLAAARERRDAAKAQIKAGVDPVAQKKRDRQAAAVASANTFGLIADELVSKLEREGIAPRTLDKTKWLLGLARPDLGDMPIRQITAADVLAVLQPVAKRGHRETSVRLRALISRIFRYGVATARAEVDPTFALRDALDTPKVTHRAAITDPKAFGGLLRAIDGMTGFVTTRIALQMLALTFPRPGELRGATWAEFDLDESIWRIPAERMKMRKPHAIPLARQAVAALSELKEFAGAGKLAFPSVRSSVRPLSENTLNAALRRLGFTQEEHTAHGFRASASTLLNESGKWSPDAVERALAHQDEDAVRRAYARGQFWTERVEMAQWWADHLDTLRAGAKIIAMPKTA